MSSSQVETAGMLTDAERAEMKAALLEGFRKTSDKLNVEHNWAQASYAAELAMALVALDENSRNVVRGAGGQLEHPAP